MDVSGIEAFNPNKINWRNLTAKEILKYEKQGVEVPDLYVQWAHEFLNNLQKYDSDEVTYEKAQSITRYQSSEEKTNKQFNNNENINIDNPDNTQQLQEKSSEKTETVLPENTNINTDNADIGGISTQNATEAVQLTAAQKKRRDFIDNDVNLRKQAVSFIQDSNSTGQQAVSVTQIIRQLQTDSDNEISELETMMKELIAQADAKQQELKQEVYKINQEKSDNSTFSQIDKLQRELQQLGMTGHNAISQTLGILRSYGGEIMNGQDVMLNAADFGSETINIGNELLSTRENIFNIIIGQDAVDAGDNALTKAKTGESTVTDADDANNANIGRIPELRNSVTEKTGIEAQNAKQQGNASEQDPITGKEKESDKEIKTAQNDGTDTTDKLHISIDELVKRKVRRGEYAQGA